MANAVRSPVGIGSALADIGRKLGGVDLDVTRHRDAEHQGLQGSGRRIDQSSGLCGVVSLKGSSHHPCPIGNSYGNAS